MMSGRWFSYKNIFIIFFLYFFKKKKKLNELQTEVFTSSFMQIAANKLGATQESDEESLLKKKVKIFE